MPLTVKQIKWLYDENNAEYWHYYEIKEKIRDAYIIIDQVLSSNRADEFIDEIIPFIRIIGDILDKIPFEVIATHILPKINSE